MAANRVIGHHNKIPWHIPGEQLRFKKITMGYPLIMGRKTWEDIGRVLPGRRNIVLSRNPDLLIPGGEAATSLSAGLLLCQQESKIFIIGGEQVFRASLPLTDTIILTVLPNFIKGDAWFPEFSENDFSLTDLEEVNSLVCYTVKTYRRSGNLYRKQIKLQ